MYKYECFNSTYPIYQTGYAGTINSNIIYPYNYRIKNPKYINKKVTFNRNVIIYNVESYKEHNKKYCYKEDEEFKNLLRNNYKYGYNDYRFKKYLGKFKNNKKMISPKKEEDSSKFCCFIL